MSDLTQLCYLPVHVSKAVMALYRPGPEQR